MTKYIKLNTWRKQLPELQKTYTTLKTLDEACQIIFRDHYNIILRGALIEITPANYLDDDSLHPIRDCRFYTRTKPLKQINTEDCIDFLIERLKDNISIEKLLKDALYDTDIADLMELGDRLTHPVCKITEKEGCYKLTIGGKKGAPFEFMLRD